MSVLELTGGCVELDDEGHLKDFEQWSVEAARALAEADGFELTDAHLAVLFVVRTHYEKHKVAPMLPWLSRECELAQKELHGLFGKQPGKRAAKFAGLPKATGCT